MTSDEFFAQAMLSALGFSFATLTADESVTWECTPEQRELIGNVIEPAGIFAMEAARHFEKLMEIRGRGKNRPGRN